jgi:putative oxidoreductase
MKTVNTTFLLRLAIAIVFLSHCLHGIIHKDVGNFGNLFLNKIGFAPYGVALAWAVIISQLVGSLLLLLNKYVNIIVPIFIAVLSAGIYYVHYAEGWYVVGAGRNGMEFSVVLILILIAIVLPKKWGGAR